MATAPAEERRSIIRRAYDAFNRRDLDAIRDDMHPEFELDFSRSVGPERGVYRGVEGIGKLWEAYWDAFESISIEPEELIETGDAVVVVVRAEGRGRGSGAEVRARGPHLWRFREGKVISFEIHQELPDALRAAAVGD